MVVANSVINLEDFSCKYFAQTCLTTADSGEELIVHNTMRSCWTAQNLSITSCKTFNLVSKYRDAELTSDVTGCNVETLQQTEGEMWQLICHICGVLGVIGDMLAVVMYSSPGRGGGWRPCQRSRVLLSPLMD